MGRHAASADASLAERYGIAPHATRRTARLQIAVGVGLLAVAGAMAAMGEPWAALVVGGLGPVFLVFGGYTHVLGPALQVVNRAFREATHGEIAAAEELLAHAEARHASPFVRRVINLQRAAVALRRGALEEALAHATLAVERPLTWILRDAEKAQRSAALGLRAFVRASLGDADGAEADIAAVRALADAAPETLARAELARAMLLERSGDRGGLGAHLSDHAAMLLEHTRPRERAIVRALQRMLESKPVSVYRKPPDKRFHEEPPLDDWVALVVPGVAPFVRTADDSAPRAEPAPRRVAGRPVDALLAPKRQPGQKRVVLWVVFVVVLAVLGYLATSRPEEPPIFGIPPTGPIVPWWAGGGGFALLIGWYGFRIWASFRDTRRMRAIAARLARTLGRRDAEDRKAALATLRVVAERAVPLTAAQAHLTLAEIALAEAAPEDALRHLEAGTRKLSTDAYRAYAGDILLPELLAQQASLHAAAGAEVRAREILEAVEQGFPSFPFLERARLRVALYAAARRGDVADLAELAHGAGEVPTDPRDELVLDLARAATRSRSAGAGEIARLERTLRHDADARRWLAKMAPRVVDAFEAAVRAPSVDREGEAAP